MCVSAVSFHHPVPHHPSNLLRTSLINNLIYDLTVERRIDAQDTDTDGINGKVVALCCFFGFFEIYFYFSSIFATSKTRNRRLPDWCHSERTLAWWRQL